jgi:hypothetical protein
MGLEQTRVTYQAYQAYRAAVVLTVSSLMAITTGAFAQAGGQPLVLDTQTGIHSGVAGTVLQTGPLNGSGTIPARPMATLPELSQQDRQTIVVSPYIEIQPSVYTNGQGQGSGGPPANSTGYRHHRSHAPLPHSSSPFKVPAGVQLSNPQTESSTQPAPPKRVAAQPAAQPVAAPKPITAKPSAPWRPSDPHSAAGSVTTSAQ